MDVKVPQHENQVTVGIDLGINSLATLSSGIQFEVVKDSLPLSNRIFACECGFVQDRDLNASLNLCPLPRVTREFTPGEMAALWKQAGLVFTTSIGESGNQLQPAC